MHLAISSDGQLSRQEMLRELSEERICPVMVYVEADVQIAPVFATQQLAYAFAKRNTPKAYSIGTMEADEEDLEALRKAGFEVRELPWPNKRACSVHVLLLDKPTETHAQGWRNQTRH
jgi:hypothetical protein